MLSKVEKLKPLNNGVEPKLSVPPLFSKQKKSNMNAYGNNPDFCNTRKKSH